MPDSVTDNQPGGQGARRKEVFVMWASRMRKRMRVYAVALVPAVWAFAGIAVSPLGAEVANAEGPSAAGSTVAMFGGTTSKGWPVFAQVSANGRMIKRIVGAITADCTQGGMWMFPSDWRRVPISRAGTFRVAFHDSDTLDDGVEVTVSETLSGRLNRAHTRISARWHATSTLRSPDGTVDTCDTGTLGVALHR